MIFEPLRTERLLLRPMRSDDAVSIAARRSHPDVARYQNWTTPYPLERAQALVDDIVAMDGPTDGEWWMLTIADPDDSTVIGDLVVHLTWQGRTAEIGYTLAPDAWGAGYAVEAATELVRYLFDDLGVTRIEAMLHPDNPGVSDGARTHRHAVRGPHPGVVLARRRQQRRLDLRHDPGRLGRVAGPAAATDPARSGSSRSPPRTSPLSCVWRHTSPRSDSSRP